MSALYFDARIDGTELQADIANINRQLSGMTGKFEQEGQKIDNITRRMAQGLATYFSVFTATNMVKDIASVRGEFQQLEVAFETMLGSKEKADRLMAQVVDFAARTPFELGDVAGGAKQLLAYGTAAEDVLPTLKALGDVSAGLSVPIERLILNYGQVRTQLKLTGRELRDFQVAGIPIVSELAKNLDVSEKKIQGMVSAGEIGFKDVETAFLSMTEEGGRFNNLMDKQAKTITGLASNFADAWDRMLNSIGTNQEGLIANSIKGATTLVDNYEEVLDILKVLIATYGTYKAAVIATAAIQRSSAWIDSIRLIAMYRKEMGLATATQQAFNVSAKANPYALILSGVVTLITALTLFGKETKKAQDYIDDLNDSAESIGKQNNVDKLVNRYTELIDKTKKTKEEQEELNYTISELSTIFPTAISETDKFGNTLDLTTDKVIALNDQLRENAQLVTEKSLEDAQTKQNELIAERNKLLQEANQGYSTETIQYQGAAPQQINVELGTEAIENRRKKVQELNAEIQKLGESISKAEDELNVYGSVDAEKALQPYKKLFGDVTKYSEEQAQEITKGLENILTLGLGKQADKIVRQEIDKIAEQLALPTIKDQITQTIKDIESAQAKLDALRAPGSKATDEDITSQEKQIKDLQSRLETLTGVRQKDYEKQQSEAEKNAQKLLEAREEYLNAQLDLERRLQSSRIAIMKDGADKEREEAKLSYQLMLDEIQKQQDEYLKLWNQKTTGAEPGDKNYVQTLPEAEMQRFNEMRLNAETEFNQRVQNINKDSAETVKAIWNEAADAFLSDMEREILSVNQFYDNLIKRAREAGELDLIPQLEQQRTKALNDVKIKNALNILDMEEDIEIKRAELNEKSLNRSINTEIKRLDIQNEYAKKRIDLLKKIGDAQSKKEIEMLELSMKETDKRIDELTRKKISQNIQYGIDFADMLIEKLHESLGLTEDQYEVLKGGLDAMSGIAKIASGDVIGGTMQLVGAAIDLFVQAPEKLSEGYANMHEQINKVIKSAEIANETLSRLGSINGEFNLAFIQSGLRQVSIDAAKLNEELEDVYYGPRGGTGTNVYRTSAYSTIRGELVSLNEEMEKLADRLLAGNLSDEQRKAIEEVLGAYNDLMNQMDTLTNDLIGTTTNDLANYLVDAFLAGENAAEAWGDKVNEIIKKIMTDQLAAQLLVEPIQKATDVLIKNMEDGLVPSEMESYKDAIQQAMDAAAPVIEATKDAWEQLGFSFSDAAQEQGLQGIQRSITEETGSLLVGQFASMREYQQKGYLTGVQQLDALNRSAVLLQTIANNTGTTNTKLDEVSGKLDTMNKTLKDGLG
nr:tape measure protein [uncultured Draconibacterium sp.]